MADENPESNPSNVSPAARKLAERYGVTPEAMERIISSATKDPASATTATPPVPAHPPAPIENAAAKLPSSPMGRLPAPNLTRKQSGISGGLMAALVTLLLIGLAVAFSFEKGCFRQRTERMIPNTSDTINSLLSQQDTAASTPPVPPSQGSASVVPPEALAVPRESPPGTTGPVPKTILGKEQMNVGTIARPERSIRTTSNLNAQEKLAEMRAAGYSRARLRTVRHHGVRTHVVSVH